MRNSMAKRLQELEDASGGNGRVRYAFRWSSQDHEEAMERWERSLEARGDPLRPSDKVYCIIWNDEGRSCADDWHWLDAPSYPSEPRLGDAK